MKLAEFIRSEFELDAQAKRLGFNRSLDEATCKRMLLSAATELDRLTAENEQLKMVLEAGPTTELQPLGDSKRPAEYGPYAED